MFVLFVLFAIGAHAQTKTAYCDVYLRGGGLHLKATVSYKGISYKITESTTIGNILALFTDNGWNLDESIVIPRHTLWSIATRHKLHLIMRKEFFDGENPFVSLEKIKHQLENSKHYKHDIPSESSGKDIEFVYNQYKVGDKIEYNGISATIIHTTDTHITLATQATDELEGTWDEAIAYCKSLGKEWRLLSVTEFKQIKYKLPNNDYWTNEEIDKNKAKYFDRSINFQYKANKNKKFSILPITVADINAIY